MNSTSNQIEQRSPEWLKIRIGKITASNCGRMMSFSKRDKLPTAENKKYITDLVLERLNGQATEFYVNPAMQWGIENEPVARVFYEYLYEVTVQETGFIHHPKYDFIGASPDGLIGDDGLLEIKCPTTSHHLEILLSNKPDEDHVLQCMFQLWVTNRQYCSLLYFDPRMIKDDYKGKVFHLERDETIIQTIESRAMEVDAEVISTLKKLKEDYE